MTGMVRVVVGEPAPLLRDGMVRALRQDARFQLVGEASGGADFLEVVEAVAPDVALLRGDCADVDAGVILRRLRREERGTRVLVVGDTSRPAAAYDAIADGAAGWLAPTATAEELRDAVAVVAGGESYLGRELQGGIAREIRLRQERTILSPREQEILLRMAAGSSGPSIASALHVSLSTVRTHVAHLYEKLGVTDRAAAVAEGMRRGLLD